MDNELHLVHILTFVKIILFFFRCLHGGWMAIGKYEMRMLTSFEIANLFPMLVYPVNMVNGNSIGHVVNSNPQYGFEFVRSRLPYM